MTVLLRLSDSHWPVPRSELHAAYPLTAFPADLTKCDLSDFGYALPAPTDPPPHNPTTQRVEEVQPVLVGSTWRQAWQVVELPPPPPAPDWDRFQADLRTANGFPAAWGAIFSDDPRPGIGLIAALMDWRATGQWAQFLGAALACLALLPPEQAIHVGLELLALATDCNLDPAFCEALETFLEASS